MPDELKIPVSVPGAEDAAGKLRDVAAAEGQVAGAAIQAGGAAAPLAGKELEAASAAEILGGRNVHLLNSLRRLGPECALAADALSLLVRHEAGAAMAMGILGVAIVGVTMAIGKYRENQDAQRREAADLLGQLIEQREAYTKIEAAVERVRLAEARRGRPGGAIIPEEVIRQAGQIALAIALPAEGLEALAGGIVSEGMDEATATAYGLWLRLGYGDRFTSDKVRSKVFRSRLARDPGLPGKLEREQQVSLEKAPGIAEEARMEVRERLWGMGPEAAVTQAYEYVARRETMAGRPRTTEGMREYVRRLTGQLEAGFAYAEPGELLMRQMRQAQAELEALVRTYPEALRLSGITGEPVSRYVYRPGTVYHGGTHYHGQYEDPTAVPVQRAE